MRLLDQLDFELIRRNPKPLIGYSDITALHTAIYRHAGLLTFHGGMLNADLLGPSCRQPRLRCWRSWVGMCGQVSRSCTLLTSH